MRDALASGVRSLVSFLREPLVSPPPPPAPPAPAAATPPAPTPDWSGVLLGYLGKAALAVAAGAGVAGALAVVGGTVEWLRFRDAGLPAQDAVAAMPKEELVVAGIIGSLAFVLAALAAVLLLFLVDPDGFVRGGTVICLAGLAATGIYYVLARAPLDGNLPEYLAVGICIAFVLCLLVAWSTGHRFAPLGVVVFGLTLALGVVTWYFEAREDPMVQPAAILRSEDRRAVVGIFVADTDNHVYLGGFRANDGLRRALYKIPKTKTTRVAIGASTPCARRGPAISTGCKEARRVALELARQLRRDRRAERPAAKNATPAGAKK